MELIASFAPLELIHGCRIVFEAIDPATGANVAGVTVSAATITVDAPDDLPPAPDAPPLLTIEPNAKLASDLPG